MKQFYGHLIEIESILIELDKLDLTKEQKLHLTSLVDSSLHHTVLDVILSELPTVDKKIFLTHLKENDHGKIWQFLNQKAIGVEEKIKKAVDDLKMELHKDLNESQKQK